MRSTQSARTGGGEWPRDYGNRLQRQWSRWEWQVLFGLMISQKYSADPPFVDILSNVLSVRTIKSIPGEFSFYGVNLTFLLIIIVLSIICLNILFIGISITIYRSIFWRTFSFFTSFFLLKNEKEKRAFVYCQPRPDPPHRHSHQLGSCVVAVPLVRDSEETFVWESERKGTRNDIRDLAK